MVSKCRPAGDRRHDRRSEGLHEAVDRTGEPAAPGRRHRSDRVRLPGEPAVQPGHGFAVAERTVGRAALIIGTLMRPAIAFAVLALAVAVNLRLSAQGARPPDIAGEWRLDSAEDPGQPPLADYLGLALNEAGR